MYNSIFVTAKFYFILFVRKIKKLHSFSLFDSNSILCTYYQNNPSSLVPHSLHLSNLSPLKIPKYRKLNCTPHSHLKINTIERFDAREGMKRRRLLLEKPRQEARWSAETRGLGPSQRTQRSQRDPLPGSMRGTPCACIERILGNCVRIDSEIRDNLL